MQICKYEYTEGHSQNAEPSSPLKYDSSHDADDVFFLSLWVAVFAENNLEYLDTVQVSQNPFFKSK